MTRNCMHRGRAEAAWILNNPGEGPPVVWIASPEGNVIATLTNQTIYLNCPECFRKSRSTLDALTLPSRSARPV
jgi:hypothetical protein